MEIRLSDHFTYKKLIRYTLPSIAMMIFTSIYGVVDGFFVSNFVGKTPFAAVNFIMPLLMILGAVGFMFGTGGCALVSKYMGEGNSERANRTFSMLIYVTLAVGSLIALTGILALRPIASLLGASGRMLEDCVLYGRIVLLALPAFMLQIEFQSFLVSAERPKLGLFITLASGIANMLLDALLVGILPLGLVGAALATAISQLIGGIVPLLYFAFPNKSTLRLTGFSLDLRALLRTCANGSSELMSNVSMSLVGMLYNVQLMKYEGENGVAAYGVLMYVSMIFMASFIGYIIGVAPIISYHYGAQNHDELKSLRKKSLRIILYASLSMLVLGELLSQPLSLLFVSYDPKLYDLTLRGFFFYSFSYLFCGIAIFGSGFFTALNNGLVSAIISFLRTLVFQIIAVLVFPLLCGIDGIWLSIVFAELAAALITSLFLKKMQKRYHY